MADLYAGAGQGEAAASAPAGTDAAAAAVEETPIAPVASTPTITLADVQAAIESALAGYSQKNQRAIQSQLDKRDGNLQKQIKAIQAQAGLVKDQAKASGLEEAQADQIGQRFFNANLTQLLSEEEAKQPPAKNGRGRQQPEPDDDGETEQPNDPQQVAAYQQFITSQGDLLRDAYGMPYDAPEMKTLILDQGEQAYFNSIKAAGKAYQARVSKAAQPPRIPGMGVDGGSAPSNPIEKIDNPSELYKLAAKQANQARSGNPRG